MHSIRKLFNFGRSEKYSGSVSNVTHTSHQRKKKRKKEEETRPIVVVKGKKKKRKKRKKKKMTTTMTPTVVDPQIQRQSGSGEVDAWKKILRIDPDLRSIHPAPRKEFKFKYDSTTHPFNGRVQFLEGPHKYRYNRMGIQDGVKPEDVVIVDKTKTSLNLNDYPKNTTFEFGRSVSTILEQMGFVFNANKTSSFMAENAMKRMGITITPQTSDKVRARYNRRINVLQENTLQSWAKRREFGTAMHAIFQRWTEYGIPYLGCMNVNDPDPKQRKRGMIPFEINGEKCEQGFGYEYLALLKYLRSQKGGVNGGESYIAAGAEWSMIWPEKNMCGTIDYVEAEEHSNKGCLTDYKRKMGRKCSAWKPPNGVWPKTFAEFSRIKDDLQARQKFAKKAYLKILVQLGLYAFLYTQHYAKVERYPLRIEEMHILMCDPSFRPKHCRDFPSNYMGYADRDVKYKMLVLKLEWIMPVIVDFLDFKKTEWNPRPKFSFKFMSDSGASGSFYPKRVPFGGPNIKIGNVPQPLPGSVVNLDSDSDLGSDSDIEMEDQKTITLPRSLGSFSSYTIKRKRRKKKKKPINRKKYKSQRNRYLNGVFDKQEPARKRKRKKVVDQVRIGNEEIEEEGEDDLPKKKKRRKMTHTHTD